MSNDPKLDELVQRCREASIAYRAACDRLETARAELRRACSRVGVGVDAAEAEKRAAMTAEFNAGKALDSAGAALTKYIFDSTPDPAPVDGGGP